MTDALQAIRGAVVSGNAADVESGIRKALDAKLPVKEILDEGLIAAMTAVGEAFELSQIYVPEMLVAARAMQAGLALLKPSLVNEGIEPVGRVVIGTVKGDLHDIGKNLVAMMLQGAGFDIIDLGTDVSPDKFAAAVREHRPSLVGMSALLTTTMKNMRATIEAIGNLGLRDQVKVIVGGAPLTEGYAKEIGADGYAPDASQAVVLAKSLP